MRYRLVGQRDSDDRRRVRRRRAARRTLSVLPTLFTLGNLLCGFAAIFVASRPLVTDAVASGRVVLPWNWTPLTLGAVLIFLGMVFDGLDGRIARLTHNTSDLGEQLDSMADMVTFGVAPAFLAVQLAGVGLPFLSENADHLWDRFVLIVAGIYVACAALRLARFNIEVEDPSEASHMSFKGLPSPGAAGTVASLILLHQHFLARHAFDTHHESVWLSSLGMVAVMGLTAFAMVSKLRYAHVLNRFIRGRARVGRIAQIVVIIGLVFLHFQGSLAAAFSMYAASAPVGWFWRRIFPRPETAAPVATATAEKPPARQQGT
jgi:CDP-diacylglycerol--serine O-phosphatidyltransferase